MAQKRVPVHAVRGGSCAVKFPARAEAAAKPGASDESRVASDEQEKSSRAAKKFRVSSTFISTVLLLVFAANATYGCSSPKQLLNVRGSRPLFAPQRDFIPIWVFKMSKSPFGVLFNRDWRQSPLANFRDIAVVIINSKYDRHTCRTSLRGILTFWVNSEEKWSRGCVECSIKATTRLVSFYTDFGIPIS